jgi:hypothetical protein
VRIPLTATENGPAVSPVLDDANLPPLDILVADDVVQNLNLINSAKKTGPYGDYCDERQGSAAAVVAA